MKTIELEQSIPGQIRAAKRRTAEAIETASSWKALEEHREKVNHLYLALFFWEKYHKRKRTHDFHTTESKQQALQTIIDYLRRI